MVLKALALASAFSDAYDGDRTRTSLRIRLPDGSVTPEKMRKALRKKEFPFHRYFSVPACGQIRRMIDNLPIDKAGNCGYNIFKVSIGDRS